MLSNFIYVLINAIILCINTCLCVLINQYSTGLFVSHSTHRKTLLHKTSATSPSNYRLPPSRDRAPDGMQEGVPPELQACLRVRLEDVPQRVPARVRRLREQGRKETR
jgi:hypothetical protein